MKASAGDAVMMSGYVQKQSRDVFKRWLKRYCVIAGHHLKYYNDDPTKTGDEPKGILDLSDLSIVELKGSQLRVQDRQNRRVVIKCASNEEAQQWGKAIQDVVAEQKLQQRERRSCEPPNGRHALNSFCFKQTHLFV